MGEVRRIRVAEKDVQSMIVELAGLHGWRVYHTFDSRRSAAGFPDLMLVRERIVFAELKRAGEKPRRDQVEWLDALARSGAEVYLWTIDDLVEIGRILAWRWWFDGEGLFGDKRELRPRSAWIPGHGRRDA